MTKDIYSVKTVSHPHQVLASVPGSKSISSRALLLAALANGRSVLQNVSFCDDCRYFADALSALGFSVDFSEEEKKITLTGCGGRIPKDRAEVFVGSAGTAARFLSAMLGLSAGRYRMDASEQMRARPMKELLDVLQDMGAKITYEGEKGHFPFTIGNGGKKAVAEICIDVEKSSQFLSALLISSVLCQQGLCISVKGTHGMAYVRMTVSMMRRFCVSVSADEEEKTFRIAPGSAYRAQNYLIEPDVSAACPFYAAGALLGVPAEVLGVHRDCLQGDIRFLDVLCDMGCTMREEAEGIWLLPPKEGKLSGGEWDLSAFSDQALLLAAMAPFAKSPVFIRGIAHIRLQESDRIEAMRINLQAMGVQVKERDDGIEIFPCAHPHGARIETFGDHRVAMAFAVPGLLLKGGEIENPSCCEKTFPDYFSVLEEAVR